MSDTNIQKKCIICGEERVQGFRKIQQLAIAKLVELSKKRRTKEHVQWSKLTTAYVHNNCNRDYHRDRKINAAAAEFSRKVVEGKSIAKDAYNFDFATRCLFCGLICYSSREDIKHVVKDETRENILTTLKERDQSNSFNKNLLKRLQNALDLVKVKAQYHSSCMSTLYGPTRPSDQVGRPSLDSTINFVHHAINYMENCESESQFSLNEIKEEFVGTDFPDLKTIKSQLKRHYNDNIDFSYEKKDTIILLKHKINPNTWKDWYKNQKKNEEEEKKRIIQMAAELLLQDIRSKIYDRENYIIPNFNEDNIFDNIPESLVDFLSILIKSHKNKKKSNDIKWNKRVATIGHVIITSARPRSFLSPILIGLSAMMHKQFASRGLLECLSHVGFSASYDETRLFESSIIAYPDLHTLSDKSFVQFVYDNADHNTATIDGKGTFHAMGGIQIVTPGTSVESKKTIPRLKKIQSSNTIGQFGFNPLKKYTFDMKKCKLLKIEDVCLHTFKRPDLEMEDFMFLYSKYSNGNSKGYGGFMEDFYVGSKFDTSKIFPLPFVKSPPSEYHTIFTVLVQAASHNKRYDKDELIFVTFDQPLYLKARFILSCVDPNNDPYGLSKVRVRLGGFHTLMSFIGSVAFIMDGSGLKEAFYVIFAENSAEKALDARAYSRGLRGHFLTQIALTKTIFDSIQLTDEEKAKLNAVLTNLGSTDFEKDINSKEMRNIRDKFIKEIESIEKRGPTAQLWIQYWDMLSIIRNFVKAERSGNWKLHLECIRLMIPFFHATGHFNYAKSAQLYLQDMLQLEEDMDPNEYEIFTTKSYFTIRRSEKFWSGVWSDMIIEQFLMRSMKTQGGLTHGRGMGDSVIAKFVLTMIILIEVCNSMEAFCDVSYSSSEQHVDSTDSRIKRDAADVVKLIEYFDKYHPFPVTEKLISIYSGIVADNSINCHRAYDIGMQSVQSIVNENFQTVKLSRKSRVLSLKTVLSSITVNKETIPIDPLLLFQRLCVNINKKSDMKRFLTYELAPLPLSLFTENGFRKNEKSQLYDLFTKTTPSDDRETLHVIDGGYLLRKVVWHKFDTLEEIIKKYLSFVKNHYKDNCCIIFDGYPNSNETDVQQESVSSTKAVERFRRQGSSNCPAFELVPHKKIPTTQDKFLSNEKNKVQLIKRLYEAFTYEGILIRQAKEDADVLIVNTAIELAEKNKFVNGATGEVEYTKNVIIVGQDIDLLVLLHQLNVTCSPVYFLKCGVGNIEDSMYSSHCFNYNQCNSIIAFLHSFSGCDTTSSFAGKGKKTLVDLLVNTPSLGDLVKPFYEKSADPRIIAQNGCELIASIYNRKNNKLTLDELRFERYEVLTNRCNFTLDKLPPTVGAAVQHAYRCYHQIQMWLGNEIDATKWGWREVLLNDCKVLMPRYTVAPLIPEDVLKKVSCRCTKDCSSTRCGCRKLGLKCTLLCTMCEGSDHCSNKELIEDDESDSEEFEQPNLILSHEDVDIERGIENDGTMEGENEEDNESENEKSADIGNEEGTEIESEEEMQIESEDDLEIETDEESDENEMIVKKKRRVD